VAFGETQPPPAPDSELIRAIFSSILRQSASADVACGGSGMNARISGTTVPKKEPIDNAIKFCTAAQQDAVSVRMAMREKNARIRMTANTHQCFFVDNLGEDGDCARKFEIEIRVQPLIGRRWE
jgi:hydroxypyruvate isomerase